MSLIYQNAYSFDSNYIPQPQNENHLCNLCGNNSHDGYDCQQQFSFVYKQEPSYNQNYDVSTHGPKNDFSNDDQIQNPQYPDVQENPLTNDEFKAYTIPNDANMNDLQFKLDKNQQNFQKKFEQKQGDFLDQMRNFMQNFHDGLLIPPPGKDKEHEATKDTELPSTEDIQPLLVQEPAQESNICQLIREECCVEASEEQKQNYTQRSVWLCRKVIRECLDVQSRTKGAFGCAEIQ
nr:hypothetical protein [Tanacetum cinerariifolium]